MKIVNPVCSTESGFCNYHSNYSRNSNSTALPVVTTETPVNIPDELVNQVLQYEQNQLSQDDKLAFFQLLIDTGLATQFGGRYPLIAKQLILSGLCKQAA